MLAGHRKSHSVPHRQSHSPRSQGIRVKTIAAITLLLLASRCCAAGEDWPQFRGPDGQGHSSARGLPIAWSETRNVAWKTAIPGRGWSSPVVRGDQIWLTTALDEGKSLRAVCIAARTGKLMHDVEVFRPQRPPPVNAKNSYASPTPVIEKDRLWVHFGTHGTACLNTENGAVLWRNEDLRLDHKEGPGSSPIVCGQFLIVNCDGIDVQYVVALDKGTGRVAWKADRTGANNPNPDFRKAFSTPLAIDVGGRQQIISIGADRAYAYDPLDGRELWWVDIPGFSNVPRPILGNGLVYIATGYLKPQLWAICPDGNGDVSGTHVAWRAKNQAPANPSPVLVGDLLFMVSDQGVATCLDARSGQELGKARLGGNYSASPVAADGRIYFFSEGGEGIVVAADKSLKILARNRLEGRILASPAVVNHGLLVRTETHLYRIEDEAAAGQN
jgi:outer membrane protein assembly factor BamB